MFIRSTKASWRHQRQQKCPETRTRSPRFIQQELAQPTPDLDDFQSSKPKMIDIVNRGISIRTNNQKIAPSGNAAVPGLATADLPIEMGEDDAKERTGGNCTKGGVKVRSGTDR